MSKVLVVDDDFAFRSLLCSLIDGEGHEVTEAADGMQALEIIHKASAQQNKGQPPFDLVMSDFNMSRMAGYELVRAIRNEEGMHQTPIIMITATTKDIRELVETENVRYLRKLCSNNDILEAVRGFLGDPGSPSYSNGHPTAASSQVPPPSPAPPEADFSTAFSSQPSTSETPPAPLSPSFPDTSGSEPASSPPDSARIDLGNKRLALLSSGIVASGTESEETEDPSTQELSQGSTNSQLVQLVNGIVGEAIQRHASDIHIEPQRDALHVRLRIDGVLQEALRLPLALKHNVAARIKVVCSLNLAEKRLPQDGRFSIHIDANRHVEFRVSTLPSQFGETVVMRVLRHEKVMTKLNEIFLRGKELTHVERALMAPTGIILVTGPTGGGKSTTLYTMLETINNPTRKIITVEDPIEREIPGITQVAVKTQIGLTFEKVLRACLRQDPNVLMVGEIRDLETAEIAFKAAMTGHLVLSTLHTNQAHMAVYRLVTMGLKPFMVTSALRLVIAQRLLRLLCPHCKVKRPMNQEEMRTMSLDECSMFKEVYAPKGCSRCQGIGYLGRKAVMEVMPIQSHEMRQLIMECNNSDQIFEHAKSEGMITLRQGALELAAQGLTSLQEAFTIYFID